METPGFTERPRWFPFSSNEVQTVLGIEALAVGVLAFLGIESLLLAWASLGLCLLAYIVGLLVYAQAASFDLQFIQDGGLEGRGYRHPFQEARKSLLLMHVDDDVPSLELQGLYRGLLDRDVQIRRTIFLRPGMRKEAYHWVADFGLHPHLQQRVVMPPAAAVMPLSFAIVDESVVLVAVPGFHVTETKPYSEEMIFRHLLAIRRTEVTRAFLEIYEKLWRQARPVSADDLSAILTALCSGASQAAQTHHSETNSTNARLMSVNAGVPRENP